MLDKRDLRIKLTNMGFTENEIGSLCNAFEKNEVITDSIKDSFNDSIDFILSQKIDKILKYLEKISNKLQYKIPIERL